jgi:hypothetical protein
VKKEEAAERLRRAVVLLCGLNIDDFPHTRMARAACNLIEEYEAYRHDEYPYDRVKADKGDDSEAQS